MKGVLVLFLLFGLLVFVFTQDVRVTFSRQTTSDDGEGEEACVTPDGNDGTCRPLIRCLYALTNVSDVERFSCSYQGVEGAGICCSPSTDLAPRKGAARPTEFDPVPLVDIPGITPRVLSAAAEEGRRVVEETDKLEEELIKLGLTVKSGTKEAFHQAFFGSKRRIYQLGKNGQIAVETSLQLAKSLELNTLQGRSLKRVSIKDTPISNTCPKPPPCPSSKYRTSDGSCNNLNNLSWGKSFTPFQRFLPPKYFDGIDAPRIAADGGPLPSARDVSDAANPDKDVPNAIFTLIIMQWAQFVDHDITLTAITKNKDNEGILCCDPKIQRNPKLLHPACFPIAISKNDRFYSKFNESCMEFVRSLAAPKPECTLGSREQINQLTAFLDGSNVYGSTEEEANSLRSFKEGKLKILKLHGEQFLPQEQHKSEDCAIQEQACFLAGDERVNEQINLAIMHTLWMREHNRVAKELKKQNPGWNDQILYLESRRIVGAEIQHITYNEFLPLLLGNNIVSSYGLLPKPYGKIFDYDPKLNPSIANGFATAAYRYGHTLVQGFIDLLERNGEVKEKVPLSSTFFNPILLYRPKYFSKFVRGLVGQPAQKYDRFITSQLTNHLFQPHGHHFGLDLVALNTQRGRDHGIPPYNEWRRWCKLKPFESFDELNRLMTPQSVEAYKKLYRSVEDIDLFTAGVSERSVPDGTLGETFACIVGEQFRRLKFGDRFWYENGKLESSFTDDQLAEIRKTSLSRILCDNTKELDAVQPLAFIRASKWNPRVPCNSVQIPRLNFAKWKNEPVWS
ncbi:peroxidase-like [Centruroides vittatus]|uniref:peroxidase-like n=1 Tax=Centruroides vittatus TaxID=120091 RepID=UPI00350FB228